MRFWSTQQPSSPGQEVLPSETPLNENCCHSGPALAVTEQQCWHFSYFSFKISQAGIAQRNTQKLRKTTKVVSPTWISWIYYKKREIIMLSKKCLNRRNIIGSWVLDKYYVSADVGKLQTSYETACSDGADYLCVLTAHTSRFLVY